MKIITIRNAIIGVLLIALLSWGGFRVWLLGQPEDFQAMMHSMSLAEFWRVTYETVVPRKVEDHGGFGRRDYPGRGHSPWVMRSSLDGMPRMIHFALAPGHWLSYQSEYGYAYQFWQGELHFQGPVYDTYHGREPFSSGLAFFRSQNTTPWQLKLGELTQSAQVRYLGHFYRDKGQRAGIRLQLSAGEQRVVLTEVPEMHQAAGEVVLQRRFFIESRFPADLQVALQFPPTVHEVTGNGHWSEAAHTLWLQPEETVAVMSFAEPSIVIEAQAVKAESDKSVAAMPASMAESDCASCHHEQERIVGPAYSQVASHYSGEDREAVVRRLSEKILRGGSGNWGKLHMPAHADVSPENARAMAEYILTVQPPEPGSEPGLAAIRERYHWSYDVDVEPRPEGLHPGLQRQILMGDGFTPMVGGMALLPDERLLVVTWDPDGAAYLVDNWQGGASAMRIKRIAEGLQEPLGVAVVDGAIYVMQKQEITELIDRDGDDWIDEYRTVSNDWQASSNFHEFGFGLVYHQGYLYAGLSACVEFGGKSCQRQLPDRGRVFRVSLTTGDLEFVASGLRTPNGFGLSASGDVYVTDNQGDWLPSSKLVRLQSGAFYGWRPPAEADAPKQQMTEPVLWLPQNEVGNSPTQPLQLHSGPYRGQWLFGDVYNGGIKRAFVEEVNGQFQGAAFHYSAGLQGGVNRLLQTPGGDILVGEIGNPGNWGDVGKQWYGLERLTFTDTLAFEPKAVRVTPKGFDIEMTEPVAREADLDIGHWQIQQWFYYPSAMYGGPKYDPQSLPISALALSEDRRTLHLEIDGLQPGHVVYLRLPRTLRSDTGHSLWVNEAWYTLNAVPEAEGDSGVAQNRLSAEEKAQGWQLLFDGQSFQGWRNFGSEPGKKVQGWEIEDGSMKMVRDTSFFRFVLNYLNPFTSTPLLDLMSEQAFSEFDLSVDWKISPGGNSGIFYLVPDDGARVPWKKGIEMQVLDNDRHPDGKLAKHRAGDLYDLKASSSEPVKPVGQWNTARIRVQGGRIQHWLNGVEVVNVHRDGPEWQALLAESKFADWDGFGAASSGHIVLQDHGDTVWYRNIKIRPLVH